MLEATIHVPAMKNILKALENISEEAIFNFSPDGFLIRTVCVNRFKLLEIKASPEAFKEYRCDESHQLGVVIARMKDITKTLTTKDELKVVYDGERLMLIANGITRTIKLLRLEYMNDIDSLPEYDFNYHLKSPSKALRDFLKTLDKTVMFDVIVSEDGIKWASKHEDEPVCWTPLLTEDSNIGTPSETSYTTSEVLSGVVATNREEIMIQGGEEVPLYFTWEPHEGVNMTSIVAHRM